MTETPKFDRQPLPLTSAELANLETGGMSVTEIKESIIAGEAGISRKITPVVMPGSETVSGESLASGRTTAERDVLDRVEIELQQKRFAEEKARGIKPKTGRDAERAHFSRVKQQIIHPDNRS